VKRPRTTELHTDAIETKPIDYRWNEHEVGSDEGNYNYFEFVECLGCQKDMLAVDGLVEEHGKCDWHQGYPPAMNYYYPLPPRVCTDVARAARRIKHLPLVLVQFDGDDDQWGLALTGGGMDMAWEICEAFMRLGLLPPTHFELPAMCGRGSSSTDRWILRAYRRACRIQRQWLKRRIERTGDVERFAREENDRHAREAHQGQR